MGLSESSAMAFAHQNYTQKTLNFFSSMLNWLKVSFSSRNAAWMWSVSEKWPIQSVLAQPQRPINVYSYRIARKVRNRPLHTTQRVSLQKHIAPFFRPLWSIKSPKGNFWVRSSFTMKQKFTITYLFTFISFLTNYRTTVK